MNVVQTVHDYLKSVNPSAFGRVEDPSVLKLRRVLDSIHMAEFIAYLEKSFSIRITDQDVLARNFETVGSVLAFLETKVSAT